MKKAVLIFIFSIIFANCKGVEEQQVVRLNAETESNVTKAEETPLPEKPLPILTEEQQQNLDRRITPKIRRILDKADEINIYYDINKETKELKIFFNNVPNSGANVSDASLKKRFLYAFYYDASSDEMGAACFSPRHKLTAKYDNKTIEIDICYHCGNFKGKSSFGKIGGGMAHESKSLPLMNEIIDKYGTELQ